MQTCLGLYIENNIIKYAKVSKDNDNIKIDSFGIKFYEKLNDAIHQVIEETYSYKTPISINLSDENYNNFYVFSLLNKKDISNVINTEFESLCYDKGFNKDAFESRYMLVNENIDKEKIKVIHVSANKADIAKKTQQLEGYKVSTISPIGTSITNLLELKDKENIVIVNIEDRTTITTIIDEKIYNVDIIDEGVSGILDKINGKENSYSKAYEICKNTTIYTSEGKDLQYEENDYLEDIMPTLYNIVGEVRKITNDNLSKINKVYITGTASVINNIDIYFQEYLTDIKCEILRPYFIKNVQAKVNIKDYIEVNSPIAIALQGLGEGIKVMNFKKESLMDKLPDWLTTDIGSGAKKLGNKDKKTTEFSLKFDFKEKLTNLEQNLIRFAIGILVLFISYCGVSMYLNNSINKKEKEIDTAITKVKEQISMVESDIGKIKTNTNKYISMKEKLEELNNKISEKNKTKKAIPTLLNEIMWSIPKEVQITSIENTSGTHIVIKAQSETYQQLGYLKAKIKEDGILINVVSDSSKKQEGVVKVTIEGELP